MHSDRTWASFAASAIAVPFIEHGRSFDGWDCWGLVVCGYREVLDIELMDYRTDYRIGELRRLHQLFLEGRRAGWQECAEQLGSVALILRRGLPVHVGLVVAPGEVLHTELRIGTIRDRADALRIESFWQPA